MFGHRFRKPRDSPGMESRLYHSALTPVKLALARQQTFPEQLPGARECATFGEVVVVRYKYVTDKIRMINKKDVLPAEPQVGDIAELASHPFKEGERIFAEPKKNATGEDGFRAGRKTTHKSFGGVCLPTQRDHFNGSKVSCRWQRSVNRAGNVS
jgi:hypothetical protein